MSDFVGTNPAGMAAAPRVASIESRESWVAAGLTLALLSFAYGSPLLIVVGLKPITEDLGTKRELVALAGSLTWLGTGLGGVVMGQVAERLGVRFTVMFGAAMSALGLAVSASGGLWTVLIGHAVLVGFLGNGALYPPLIVYVSRWFDRRRGTALALISSGQYVAGMLWPSLFQYGFGRFGWRDTMLAFAALVILVVPALALFLRRPPAAPAVYAAAGGSHRRSVLGMRPNLVLGLICAAGFCCCIPMSIPQGHLVAFCSDIGISAASGALMLSVLQGAAFMTRVGWGTLADRIGGLKTVFVCSSLQALTIAAFMATRNESWLFTIAAIYGAGFSGIIPAYVVAIRELFPPQEASWRVPSILFVSMGGMAFGSWFAGALYDHFGYYGPAFAIGVLFNLANLTLVGFLVLSQRRVGGFRRALA
ncbi:MAG TPA: MFS transporter [Stellaceae bacterium]|nr:MFS transporter [Stellaceae bacterium]